MEKKTVQYKRTLRGSVMAGVGALVNGDGRRYYILEHKDASKYHKAGESQKIIIDQIELGRDSSCQVRYDDSFPTVSRRHAAIVKDGEGWKLVQLSQTNTTFLNGQPVTTEWYLQNGDEIQLSAGGPRVGFIVPAGKQSLVSSIRLTERMELFRKQALRPYKTALTVLCIVLVLLSCGGGYKLYDLHNKNLVLEEQQMAIKADNDSLRKNIEIKGTEIAQSKQQIEGLKEQLKGLKGKINRTPKPTPTPASAPGLSKDVFFIGLLGYSITNGSNETSVIEVGDKWSDEKVEFISGSGFLLNDGTFITARHVVEPWYFSDNTLAVKLNLYASNGYKVNALFYAVSSDGTRFEFSTEQFKCNRSHDKIKGNDELKIRIVSTDYTDYASANLGKKGSLVYDSELSKNLKVGDKLFIWGFPLGLGSDGVSVQASRSTAEVARDGLADQGYILTTSTGFEHGNSGGPVFVNRDGKDIVVGIVSAGAGRSTGFVVPICAVK